MALDVEVGTFTADATNTDDAVDTITVGFDPKALIIWGFHRATTNADTGNHASSSIGFCDDADNNIVVFGQNEDAGANADAKRRTSASSAVSFFSDGSTTIDKVGVVALGTGQFTVTWSTNDDVATLMHWTAFGGADITGTEVARFVKSITEGSNISQSVTTATDTQNIQANEGVIFFIHAAAVNDDSTSNNMEIGIGMATDPSEEGCLTITQDDVSSASEPRRTYKNDRVIEAYGATNGTLLFDGEFTNFTSSGFDLNWVTNNTAASQEGYLIIKGGKWEVGTDTARTTDGTKTTTTAFQPKGLFTFETNDATFGDAGTQVSYSFNIGASDGTSDEASGGTTDENSADPMNIGVSSNVLKCVRYNDEATPTTNDAEANVNAFNSLDFDLNWSNTDGTAYQFVWCVCGDGAAVAARTLFQSIYPNTGTQI